VNKTAGCKFLPAQEKKIPPADSKGSVLTCPVEKSEPAIWERGEGILEKDF
jgi:hypothetical protein